MKLGKPNNQSGYTLYTVLIILTVTAILLSLTIKHIGFTRKQTSNDIHGIQARLLAESGITRAEYFLNGGDGHSMEWETDRFEESIGNYGKILLKIRKFGLFSRIESQGIRLKNTCTISGLFGRDIPDILKPSLTLTGHVGGLILHEGSAIEGQIVLHHGDIYRERRGRPIAEYQKKLIIRESQDLPFDSLLIPELIGDLNKTHISLLSSKNALTGYLSDSNLRDCLLKNDTIVVLGDCRIEHTKVHNKLMVISGTLSINDNSSIDGSLFLAEKIIINGGNVSGTLFFSSKKTMLNGGYLNSQFYAQDTISATKEVKYGAMTVIACLRNRSVDSTLTGGICFEAGTSFKGTVIGYVDNSAKLSGIGPSVVFGKGSDVSGVIITNHDLDIKEIKIKGYVWARTIMTLYNGMSFTNYLINSTISQPDKEFFFPMIGELPARILYGK
ncbi:MAG TPA: hypothetical protein VHP36_10670 [Chitinispirillaceae bacterium]|nr:hypothetical protein [Chitinispirillaceae bacterium]